METTPSQDLKSTAKELTSFASNKAKQVAKKTEDAIEASSTFVKDHPLYTVAGAATLGFVAGMLLRRNKH